MERYIPYEKLSKRKRRELDAGRRKVWAISPVTRKPENPKAYDRKKARKRGENPDSVLSLFYGAAAGTVPDVLSYCLNAHRRCLLPA